MAVRDGEHDAVPGDGRDETETERLDRNWNGLLQELRILQTGTQILTGFLLTVAFQQRFPQLDAFPKTLYGVLVVLAAASTIIALAPVALHRALFRRRAMADLVRISHRLVRVSLGVTAVTTVGVVLLVLDVAIGPAAGVAGAALAVLGLVGLWLVLPARTVAGESRRGTPV
ncbi:DUF6328 family protein [uncultured Amnibacterium sp.]|uniref:DUF6328 family protein n=1 Tax=uncultured Amnibacterium sp. TaxID=1631851 RepID=UPI0035CB2058